MKSQDVQPTSKRRVKEKDGIRGLVPSRDIGNRDQVYGEYLKALNPRSNVDFQTALATSKDPRFKEYLERISMPRYVNVSLQTIAKACGIDLKEFQDWWQKSATQIAIAHAQTRSIELTQDMAQDAMSTDAVCSRCDGLGFIAAPAGLPKEVEGYKQIEQGAEPKWIRTCPNCKRTGTIRKPGDQHSRDRLLEMSGIIQRGKGAGVTLVQNFGGVNHASSLSALDEAMTIDGTSEPID